MWGGLRRQAADAETVGGRDRDGGAFAAMTCQFETPGRKVSK